MPKKILVSVAWPYANGPRHIGHVAGFGVPSDIFARYHRLAGNDVLMVSGTDEHGTPITVQAEKEGVSPQELVDRYNRVIGDDLMNLGLAYDLFTRTTTRNHHRVTQDLFRTLHAKGYLFKKPMPGAFSARTGQTLPDRYIEGTCPHCGYGEARGDQCDNCGKQLDPQELINPRSKIDGQPPVFKETEHYFLDLPRFVEPLRKWIGAQSHWRPNVRQFSLGLLKDLQPRAITRDLEWGVPIPLPEYAGREDKKIYVWFDAVIGYLSASIEWAQAIKGDPEAWRQWWQNPEAEHHYFMGKDNIVFHTVIWPSMLMGFGNGLPDTVAGGRGMDLKLPHNVAASEFLTMEGRKFSSSRGVVIYVQDVLSRYDADALRYYLAVAGPEAQDTDFTWAEFVRRNNDELVATWGNLVNRVLSIAQKHVAAVPQPGALAEADQGLLAQVERGFPAVGKHIEAAEFKAGAAEAMKAAMAANAYVAAQEPWKLVKQDPARAATVLYTALRAIDSLKILFAPFLPFSSQRLHEMLGYQGSLSGTLRIAQVSEDGRAHRVLTGDYAQRVGKWEPSRLTPGQKLGTPAPLFKKLEDKVVAEELARLEANLAAPKTPWQH
jgi:methionyl-tRNA synthetase